MACEKDGTATVAQQKQGRVLFPLVSELLVGALVRLLGQPRQGKSSLSPPEKLAFPHLTGYAQLLQHVGVAGAAVAHVGSTELWGNSNLLLGTPIVSFTNTTYHGQLGCCAAGAPSDDCLDCFGYHGLQTLHPFSAQSLLNIR